jgi:hypothetical protein
MKKIIFAAILLFPLSLFSQDVERDISVHFYPHSVSPKDSLQDGPFGKRLDIHEETFLIWVDLFPGMFFTHETDYILISKGSIRIERGDWWPVLNGKTVCHNEQGKFALISPFEMALDSASGDVAEKIALHIYPHELDSQDRLSDGPEEGLFGLDDNCLLVWIDLLPGAFFAHPTAYVLISREGIRTEYGSWWPVLNGKRVLYGEPNKTAIISPFKITSAPHFTEKIYRKEMKFPEP